MNTVSISDDIQQNFQLFWGNFPFPVMLVHKNRTILAINRAAEEVGYPTGMRCCDLGRKEDHQVCQANRALQEQTAKRVVGYVEAAKAVLDSYWIPLAGVEDLYVHFGIDITEYAAQRLLPKDCTAGSGCKSCSGT